MSSEESSESDSSVELLNKPIFIKKTKQSNVQTPIETEPPINADSKILHNLKTIETEQPKNEFDGIDDEDNHETEYQQWRIREYNRYIRDRDIAISKEQENEDMMKRKNMTETELVQEFNQREMSVIVKAEYEKKIDHSRPTRFRPDT